MHRHICSHRLTPDEIDMAEPNYPKTANRYGVTFGMRTAVKFHNSVKARPCVYRLTDNGGQISVWALWPTSSDQQARGARCGGYSGPSVSQLPPTTEASHSC